MAVGLLGYPGKAVRKRGQLLKSPSTLQGDLKPQTLIRSLQNNFARERRPAFYDREVYRGSYNDRYDPDQDYDDLDAPEQDYFHNSRTQDGNEGLWLGGGYKAGSSRRDDYGYDDRYQGGVSRGTSKYGNRRHSDDHGYESRRSKETRYEEGYHGFSGEDTGRSKSTGRRPWQDEQPEERTHRRWGNGGREHSKSHSGYDSYSTGHKRSRY